MSPADFLNHLIGQWTLTGQMGATPLRQAVTARWVLGGLFVEMHFSSTLPAPEGRPPYEAIYHIGYNDKADVYILHLLDTFGVATACVVGRGRREGNVVAFVFDYEGGPFTNRFIWEADNDAWRFEQTYLDDGQTRVFATKQMTRKL